MMRSYWLQTHGFLLVASLLLAGCSSDRSDHEAGRDAMENSPGENSGVVPTDTANIISQADVPTCKGGEMQLYADLAYPEVTSALRPAVIFIHGGGWTQGSRKDMAEFVKAAAQRGYVAASIQYRLTEPVFPAEIHDVKCAIRWLRAEAPRYGVNPEAIGVFGASAGAHLALILGSTAGEAAFEGEGGYQDVSSEVQAVVNWFGPTDLATLYETLDAEGQAGFEKNLGGSPAEVPDTYRRFSPVSWVNPSSSPTLTVHGDADALVPYDQALALEARFADVQGRHELYTVPGGGHGFGIEQTILALNKSFAFLRGHVMVVPR